MISKSTDCDVLNARKRKRDSNHNHAISSVTVLRGNRNHEILEKSDEISQVIISRNRHLISYSLKETEIIFDGQSAWPMSNGLKRLCKK